jgi:hypothetical protein
VGWGLRLEGGGPVATVELCCSGVRDSSNKA